MALSASNSRPPVNDKSSSSSSGQRALIVHGRDDAIFGAIEDIQGTKPFGRVLDTGTGLYSIRWIASLASKGMKDVFAVTADPVMKQQVEELLLDVEKLNLDCANGGIENHRVILGNWFETEKEHGKDVNHCSLVTEQLVHHHDGHDVPQTFDTIFAEYLIGAMDHFSPFKQDLILPKLTSLLNPGGRLYVVGMQPIPDKVVRSRSDEEEDGYVADAAREVICRVCQYRDACIKIAGARCYREYPIDWVTRQVQSIPNVKVLTGGRRTVPKTYRHETILRQINVGRSTFPYISSLALVACIETIFNDLEQESLDVTSRLPTGKVELGFDYVASVEKVQ